MQRDPIFKYNLNKRNRKYLKISFILAESLKKIEVIIKSFKLLKRPNQHLLFSIISQTTLSFFASSISRRITFFLLTLQHYLTTLYFLPMYTRSTGFQLYSLVAYQSSHSLTILSSCQLIHL